jgi:hypothetical protein
MSLNCTECIRSLCFISVGPQQIHSNFLHQLTAAAAAAALYVHMIVRARAGPQL